MIRSILGSFRWVATKIKPARHRPSIARLAIESLEDRIVPALGYDSWLQQPFTVDDVAIGTALIAPTVEAQGNPQNASFGSMIGLDTVFSNYPYRGDGYSVAVIDTGIDYSNINLGGGFGAGHRVIAGWDFVNNDADPMDDNGHGTHVAGIIGSSSATYSGLAPNVNLIALKVLDKNGSGTFGAVESALQWVISNQSRYNIVAINLSLGYGNYTANPYTFLEDEFSSLTSKGVFLSVAAGNSFYANSGSPGIGYPAISPNVVSVGAVWDGNFGSVAWGSGARDFSTAVDRIASFSQRSSLLSIMAPGAMIVSTYLNNTTQSMAGTSMAAPVVAGAAVLLHQAMDARGLTANQSTILNTMKSTGVTVKDGDDENDNVTNTGLTFKRLNIGAALSSLGGATNSAPVLQPIANQALTPDSSRDIPLLATDPNGDPITFSASIGASASTASTSQAYLWKQQLGLTYAGSYFTNAWGFNEKWLSSTSGTWYCLMPNGDLRRFTGTMTTTLQAVNLIATFTTSVYADPSLLWNAQPGVLPSVTVTDNILRITAPAGVVAGTYSVQVTASDGNLSATRTFAVTIRGEAPPTLPAIATRKMTSSSSLAVPLTAKSVDGTPITFTASIVGSFATIPATLVLNGNQLVIHSSPGFAGSFAIQVSALDGISSASTTFTVIVATAPISFRVKGDFNGDDIQDNGYVLKDGTVWISLNQSDGTFRNERWAKVSAATQWSSFQVGDFNGDGMTDLFAFAKSGAIWVGTSTVAGFSLKRVALWSPATVWKMRQVGDFNGDGKTDVVGLSYTGKLFVGLSAGGGLYVTNWGSWGTLSTWSSFMFVDVDQDGKLDLLGRSLSGKWYVGYSTGTAFRKTLWA